MSDTLEDATVAYFNAGWQAAQDSASFERKRIVKMLRVLALELARESSRLSAKNETDLSSKVANKALGIYEAIDLILQAVDDE